MENPSAFPEIRTGYDDSRHEYDGNVYSEGGMSLRDYFAAKAMQGYVTRGSPDMSDEEFDAKVSRWAYEMADAMLKAREQS